MSVKFYWQNKLILHISSGGFSELYDNILHIIENKKIKLNQPLKKLTDDLYHGTTGFGLDFAKYLKYKDDMLFFCSLVKQGIDKFIQESSTLTDESKKRLWNFHKELLNYANEFPE